MYSEAKFWISIWSIVALTIVLIAIVLTMDSIRTNEQILKADTCIKVMAINGSGLHSIGYFACQFEEARRG